MQGMQSHVNSDSTYQFNFVSLIQVNAEVPFQSIWLNLLINSILTRVNAPNLGDNANSSVWVKLIRQYEEILTMHFLKCVKIKQESKKPACA